MTTLETRKSRGYMIQVFRIMTGKDDVDPNNWFQTMADSRGTGIGTRQATGLYNILPTASNGQARSNVFTRECLHPGIICQNQSSKQPQSICSKTVLMST
jgi:hypothetical protein